MNNPKRLGELQRSQYNVLPVKEELRKNLIEKVRQREALIPGIIGYNKTVIPSVINAMLAKHDIMLPGLHGQAKSRIVRQLPWLLDEHIPAIERCEINDNPFKPVCKRCVDLVKKMGTETSRIMQKCADQYKDSVPVQLEQQTARDTLSRRVTMAFQPWSYSSES